jgi:hypothetical protein
MGLGGRGKVGASGFPGTGFLSQFASNGAGFFRRSLKIVQHLRDVTAHLAEEAALIVDELQFFLRESNHPLKALGAGAVNRGGSGATVQVHELPDFLQREAQFLQLLDGPDNLDILRNVETIARRSSLGRFQQLAPLIETDGADLNAGLFG